MAAAKRCEAQLRGVDWWEPSSRRGHQPFIELKDGLAVPNLCTDRVRVGVVEPHRGNAAQEAVHVPRADPEPVSILRVNAHLIRFQPDQAAQLMSFQDCHQLGTRLHQLPSLVGMVEALIDLFLDNFTEGHSETCHFTVFNRLALEVGFDPRLGSIVRDLQSPALPNDASKISCPA